MFSFSYFQNSVLYGTYIVNVRSHLSTAHNHQSKFQHFKRQGMIKEIVRVVVAQDDGLKEKWESTVQGTYKGKKKCFNGGNSLHLKSLSKSPKTKLFLNGGEF